ncbi:IS3 family transposase, partial [Thioclava sp. F34-6]|uniref:IS3 family transposase n=1 Tax=Thioclava sp. F34-6 TaxID=1973003 RepID=UPI001F0A701E
ASPARHPEQSRETLPKGGRALGCGSTPTGLRSRLDESSVAGQRIRRRTYRSREEARQDVFDYIEMFYNPKRKHARNGMLSPVDFERQQKLRHEGV